MKISPVCFRQAVTIITKKKQEISGSALMSSFSVGAILITDNTKMLMHIIAKIL